MCAVAIYSQNAIDPGTPSSTQNRFVVHKLPKNTKSNWNHVRDGVAQIYMDVNNQQWTASDNSIDEKNHAIFYTLQQIYDRATDQV